MKKYIILALILLLTGLTPTFAVSVDDFSSIKLLMRSISYDLPSTDKQAKSLEKAVTSNIDLIVSKHCAVFNCQNGTKTISKTYFFPFGGGASSGKSFTFMHFFGHGMQKSGHGKIFQGDSHKASSFAKLGKYHSFHNFLHESTTLHSILASKYDQNQIDVLLKTINRKLMLKPMVHAVFLMEAATSVLKFMSMNPQFDGYLAKMDKETEKKQYSKNIAFQRCILRVQLAQMKWLYSLQKKAKGGVFIVVKDRSEADSFGYCGVKDIPSKTVNRFLPAKLVAKMGSKYDKILFFVNSMLPPDNKKIVEMASGKDLMIYYKKLTNCIRNQYKLMWPQSRVQEVGPINLSTPMQSQTARMKFITNEMVKIINKG